MKAEEAFMKLDTNKFFFHYVFGKKIRDFAQDHKCGFCAEEFCFKESMLICKGIITVEDTMPLQFDAFLILAKPDTIFSNDILEIYNGEGLLMKLAYHEYEEPAFHYPILSYQCVQEGVLVSVQEITED